MTVYLSNRDGNGKTNEEGHYRLQTRVFQGFNLLDDDLKVIQTSPLSLGVYVSAGDYRLEVAAGYSYTGWLSANETVGLTTADPANPRITLIVMYVDKAAATSASPPNNPGITKLMAVNGAASAVPSAPSGAAIQSAVGAGNPYYVLASIAVAAGATQVTTANITDLRTQIKVRDDALDYTTIISTVGSMLFPIGSIYTNATNSANPSTYLGFGTWTAYAGGRVMVGVGTSDQTFAAGATGGESAHVLTVAEMPSHGHDLRVKNDDFNFTSASLGVGPTFADARDGVGSYNNFGGIAINTGGGTSHNNLQPYIVVYMWRRTA
jgi:microcystin-dependent protein